MGEKLADQISYLIAATGWRLDTRIRDEAGPLGLPMEQWRVLALLIERNGRTMSDLAQHAFIEAPTLTKMVDRMVAEALVYRVPDTQDRRRILIHLSARGRERFGEVRDPVQALEDRLARRLGGAGTAALKALLCDLVEATTPDPDRPVRRHRDEARSAPKAEAQP